MTRFALLAATLASLALTATADAQWGWGGRPSFPVIETPTNHRINPWTGGIDRERTQINNTAFDFGRQLGRLGPKRTVNRPIRDRFGNITGYERGVEWTNPFTGQVHGDTQRHEMNGSGGVDTTNRVYAPNPMAGGSNNHQPKQRPHNPPMTY